MKEREQSNYRINILETARSNDNEAAIREREVIWKRKLRPQLNRN